MVSEMVSYSLNACRVLDFVLVCSAAFFSGLLVFHQQPRFVLERG